MSSYSILGATGRVGGQIMQHLLHENDNNELHLYVRSKKKIFSSQPSLETDPRVKIYEGDLQDVDVIKRCIAGTKACFLAVALSENMPGCRIAMDTAQVVVKALDALRQSTPPAQPPQKLVVLSSSSVTDKYWVDKPRLLHKAIYNANCHIYRDLEWAEEYLRSHTDGTTLTFVKPGGLVDDKPRGYKLNPDQTSTPMSFADLAAAMVEVADEPDTKWDRKDVSITPETDGQGAGLSVSLPYALWKGSVACYLPSAYMYLRKWIP